jgi:alkylation response protein AidB-like acyl-CoA dehydrogenase
MQFGFTETQQTLKNTTRQFLAAECPLSEVRKQMETDTAFDPALWKKIAEQGWTGILFPEEYGGFGMGMVELAAVVEEMGRMLMPGPYLSTVLLAGSALNFAGTEAQKQRYLAPICSGEAVATLAFLEESASWSPDAVRLQACSTAEGFRLSGRKAFVPDAQVATFILCAARLANELALFVVPTGAKGVTVRPTPAIDGTRKLYEVMFDAVVLPADALLARGKQAVEAVEHAFAVSTVGLVAEMVGGMQRLLEMTVDYAKTRKQFGRPIGQFQAVQHLCADMLLLTESSRSAAYFAAWALGENSPEAEAAVSVAKAYASDAYREVGNKAIQVHGGMGFTWENDAHLYYRRAKGSEIAFGDANWHRERLACLVVDASGHTRAATSDQT